MLEKYNDEVEDFVGDQIYLVLKLANIAKVDAKKAIERTMKEYDERFPKETCLNQKHANIRLGGVDKKYN